MTTEHEHLLNVFESRVALIKNTLNSGLTFNLREIKIERMKSYLNLAYLSKDWIVDGRTREREEVKWASTEDFVNHLISSKVSIELYSCRLHLVYLFEE